MRDEKFSDLFKTDATHPARYTACVSVLLYKALQDCGLIPKNNTAYDLCVRFEKYNVPNGYTLSSSNEHCWCRIYWFSYYDYLKPDSWFKKLCDAADCTGMSSPDKVALNLQTCAFKAKNKAEKDMSRSPKSIRA